MDINKLPDGEISICIDQAEGSRLPTHQEYQIIRDVLGIPEAQLLDSEHDMGCDGIGDNCNENAPSRGNR